MRDGGDVPFDIDPPRRGLVSAYTDAGGREVALVRVCLEVRKEKKKSSQMEVA
jgi:hypothetical protein